MVCGTAMVCDFALHAMGLGLLPLRSAVFLPSPLSHMVTHGHTWSQVERELAIARALSTGSGSRIASPDVSLGGAAAAGNGTGTGNGGGSSDSLLGGRDVV